MFKKSINSDEFDAEYIREGRWLNGTFVVRIRSWYDETFAIANKLQEDEDNKYFEEAINCHKINEKTLAEWYQEIKK